jgi:hypothetical protein
VLKGERYGYLPFFLIKNERIGFADRKGNIIVKPQFEIVTSFNNGKAIIDDNAVRYPGGPHYEVSGDSTTMVLTVQEPATLTLKVLLWK